MSEFRRPRLVGLRRATTVHTLSYSRGGHSNSNRVVTLASRQFGSGIRVRGISDEVASMDWIGVARRRGNRVRRAAQRLETIEPC
jgi:hypothetical protein